MSFYLITFLFVAISGVFASDTNVPVKRSYVCPPHFIRLSHRCYFFSKEKVTWQEAYFQCQSMHSNLAIVKNTNQDKLIRKTLSSKTLKPLERWIGGRYDWQQKEWKWAASAKPVVFNGFHPSVNHTDGDLQWSCMILDPKFQYKWNFRSCLEEKHFICHKKIQTITNNKSRKKLLQQYNMNPLNEIPVPDISNDLQTNSTNLKGLQKVLPARSVSNLFEIEVNTNLDPKFAYRKQEKRNRRKKKRNHPMPLLRQHPNGTVYENNGQQNYRKRRNKNKEDEVSVVPMKIHYRTYKESSHSKNPLHPRPIVEEFNLDKA